MLSRSLPFHGMGGMEVVAWELSRELARIGQAVTIITTGIPGNRGNFVQDGVTVVPMVGTPPRRYSTAWWSQSRRYFEQHCMESTNAVVSVSAAGFGLLSLKRKLPRVSFIMQAHGTSWGEVASKWRSRQLRSILGSARNLMWLPKDLLAYRQFDSVVAVGNRIYKDLTRPPASWALPAARVRLINNGIDTNLFHPSLDGRQQARERLNIDERVPVVLSASRLHVQKGVAHGIRVFARFLEKAPNAIYLIAGDGPERAALEALARGLGVFAHVRFLGALDRSALAKFLQAADVFLFLTDRVEGLPLNVLEALASGLPTVISDHLSISDTPGIIPVSPRDLLSCSKYLLNALEGSGAARASLLPQQFTLAHSSEQYADLILSLK